MIIKAKKSHNNYYFSRFHVLAGLSWGILLLASPGVSHMTTVIWQLEGPRRSPHRSGALMLAVSGTSPSTWPRITWESSADLLT